MQFWGATNGWDGEDTMGEWRTVSSLWRFFLKLNGILYINIFNYIYIIWCDMNDMKESGHKWLSEQMFMKQPMNQAIFTHHFRFVSEFSWINSRLRKPFWTNAWISEMTSQSKNQWMREWSSEPMNQPMKESMMKNRWINDFVNQLMRESMIQWTHTHIIYIIYTYIYIHIYLTICNAEELLLFFGCLLRKSKIGHVADLAETARLPFARYFWNTKVWGL